MKYTDEIIKRMIALHKRKVPVKEILEVIEDDYSIKVSKAGFYKAIKSYNNYSVSTVKVADKPVSKKKTSTKKNKVISKKQALEKQTIDTHLEPTEVDYDNNFAQNFSLDVIAYTPDAKKLMLDSMVSMMHNYFQTITNEDMLMLRTRFMERFVTNNFFKVLEEWESINRNTLSDETIKMVIKDILKTPDGLKSDKYSRLIMEVSEQIEREDSNE